MHTDLFRYIFTHNGGARWRRLRERTRVAIARGVRTYSELNKSGNMDIEVCEVWVQEEGELLMVSGFK